MAWIKSEQALGSHPKLRLLAKELDISIPEAIGHLHLMWWWAVDYAEDGDVTRYKDFIPFSAQFEGDPDKFTKALVKFGWLDEVDNKLIIHDWLEYTGALIEIRQKDAERKRQSRQRSNAKTNENRANGTVTTTREWEPAVVIDQSTDYEVVNLNKFSKNVSEGRPEDVQGMSSVDKTREDKTREDNIVSEQSSQSKDIELGEFEFPNFEETVIDISSEHKKIFSVLCNTLGYDPSELTASARGQLNKATKELKDINIDVRDIPVRARNHILSFGFKATPTSLTKHWANLKTVQPRISQRELQTLQDKVKSAKELDQWANDK